MDLNVTGWYDNNKEDSDEDDRHLGQAVVLHYRVGGDEKDDSLQKLQLFHSAVHQIPQSLDYIISRRLQQSSNWLIDWLINWLINWWSSRQSNQWDIFMTGISGDNGRSNRQLASYPVHMKILSLAHA